MWRKEPGRKDSARPIRASADRRTRRHFDRAILGSNDGLCGNKELSKSSGSDEVHIDFV
jgi:hypothetical protein